MLNKLRKTVVYWGVIDLLYTCLVIITALMDGSIPYYTKIIQDFEVAALIGNNFPNILIMSTHLMLISIAFSGVLMTFSKRSGVYLSLLQSPFRFVLLLPPTFFFLLPLQESVPFLSMFLVVLIIVLEVLKIIMLLKWLKAGNL